MPAPTAGRLRHVVAPRNVNCKRTRPTNGRWATDERIPHPRKAVVRQERSAAHRVWYGYVEVSIDRGRARAAHGESALYARSARAGGCSRLTPPPHGGGNAVHGADQRGRRLAGRYVLAKFRGWRRVRQQLTRWVHAAPGFAGLALRSICADLAVSLSDLRETPAPS